MATTPVATQILCRQCTAPLAVEQGVSLVTCEFCGTANVVDKSQAVFHYAVRQTVRENDAVAALRRWMAGNKTVKDLDKKAQIEGPVFQLFPMWLVRANQNGQEMVLLEPAAALSVSELKELTVPAADLETYDPSFDEQAVEATVPYEAMLRWLENDHRVHRSSIREVALVHLPVYQCKYSHNGRRYTAVVDAATSKVFANIYPSKWEAPYFAIGAAAFAVYCCASFIPLAGYFTAEGTGLAIGVLAYLVLAVILAIPIFTLATVISAKV
ncbi:MAG: hypothetical protein L0332_00425 [Chloroflexi bacterium]|nr:hypothetical protein [Chloroflexota bacterium]MCI0575979.1 hypothetical protein [Chloroflexota bacterium]MCI0648239.1 hypothetical protein [Chloroflexota bacterium]MCI0725189.1 hypothetical protein [Chloroflexota bacterium]